MWVSSAHYTLLLDSLELAEERAKVTEQQLAIERAEHFRIVSHWANMFLRAKAGANSFPVPDTTILPEPPYEPIKEPSIDPGELAALVEEGARMGISQTEVIAQVYGSRGIPLPV